MGGQKKKKEGGGGGDVIKAGGERRGWKGEEGRILKSFSINVKLVF